VQFRAVRASTKTAWTVLSVRSARTASINQTMAPDRAISVLGLGPPYRAPQASKTAPVIQLLLFIYFL